jgi:glycosyltransferase involved in cell wall biosynthesis
VTPLRVSIVIRTLNEARHLPDVLTAIESQTIRDHERETIIVDSGSTDGTVRIARGSGCRVLHIQRQAFSFGRSLNIGCTSATGRVLVFVSGHCVPTSPDWLATLIAPLERGRATMTYGRQVGGDGTRFSERQIFRKYYPPTVGGQANGFFCNNANAALLREAWERARFDEELTGLEDLAMGKRLIETGGVIDYVPGAVVYHHHDETWAQVTRRFEREALALQSIMPEIHLGTLTAVRYLAAATAGDWRRALSDGTFLRHAWSIAAYRWCQYYGSWKGNHTHRRISRERRERYFYPHGSDTQADRTPAVEGSQRAGAGQELQALRGETPREAHAGHAARHL